MKTKLEMAHEWYLKHSESPSFMYTEVEQAWQYADAMQVEADKRRKKHYDFVPAIMEGIRNAELEEWQPDWSQAPDNDVQYFAVDEDGQGGWYITKPTLCSDHWYWSEWGERLNEYDHAPSFGYTGDWRNSLRKRPK